MTKRYRDHAAARSAVDALIARHKAALLIKTNTNYWKRFGEAFAEEVVERIKYSEQTDFARAREPEPIGWRLEAFDLHRLRVPTMLSWLARRAAVSARDYDVAVAVLAMLVERGELIPGELRSLATRLLRGEFKRPVKKRVPTNSLRDVIIRLLVRRAKEAEPELHYTSSSRSISACEIVAEHIGFEYKHVEKIWGLRASDG